MSFCRFSDGDVYLYPSTVDDGRIWVCCACRLNQHTIEFTSIVAVARHLQDHVDAGHVVPFPAIMRAGTEVLFALDTDPTRELVQQAAREYIRVDAVFKNLELLIKSGEKDWQEIVLAGMETVDPKTVWQDHLWFLDLVRLGPRFEDRPRVRRILASWRDFIAGIQSETSGSPSEEEIIKEILASQNLLHALFGEEGHGSLEELRKTMDQAVVELGSGE